MDASIKEIKRPSGTLKKGEIAPLFVTITYDKLGEAGASLRAFVYEKAPRIFMGRADSILLKKKGTYTFPQILMPMSHTGDLTLLVEIEGPNARILASKYFAIKVVQ